MNDTQKAPENTPENVDATPDTNEASEAKKDSNDTKKPAEKGGLNMREVGKKMNQHIINQVCTINKKYIIGKILLKTVAYTALKL